MALLILAVELEQIAGGGDVERGVGLAVDHADVAVELGVEFAGPEQLDGEDFQTVAEQGVERFAHVAEGEEIGEDDGDASAAVFLDQVVDALVERLGPAGLDGFDEAEEFAHAGASDGAAGADASALGVVEGADADALVVEKAQDAERRRQLLRKLELALKI